MHTIDVYTDGGCHGNPGPGAWAYVVRRRGGELLAESSGGDAATTNNRMELQAVIEALTYLETRVDPHDRAVIHTDSQYVKNGITSWIRTWLRNGWQTSAKKPVKNRDLWVALHEISERLGPEWTWVRGHAGDELNERCDELVQQEIGRIELRS